MYIDAKAAQEFIWRLNVPPRIWVPSVNFSHTPVNHACLFNLQTTLQDRISKCVKKFFNYSLQGYCKM